MRICPWLALKLSFFHFICSGTIINLNDRIYVIQDELLRVRIINSYTIRTILPDALFSRDTDALALLCWCFCVMPASSLCLDKESLFNP